MIVNDYSTQVVLEEVFKARGHEATFCSDTQQAWQFCQQRAFDLVFLDLLLPTSETQRLCQCIRSLPGGERYQIIAISGSAFGGDLPAALEAGVNDYLSRPLDMKLLNVRLALSEQHAQDLLARTEAEFALRQSEKRFRALLENSLDATILLNAEGKALYATPSITRILGYPLDEYVGRQTFELVHPDDMEAASQAFGSNLKVSGGVVTMALRVRHKDGSYRWLDTAGYNFLNEPAVRAIIVNVRDITERKLAEETLTCSEERYRTLVELSNDLIWSIDTEGRWTFLNRQATKSLFGYEPEEMLGRKFTEFETPAQARIDMDVFAQVLAGMAANRYETVLLRKDGTPVHMSYNAVVVRDAQGKVVGTTGTASDITTQKYAQSLLLEGEARLRLALSAAGMGSWDVELSTGDTVWDEGSCAIFGFGGKRYVASQALFMSMVHCDDRALMDTKFKEVIRTGSIFKVEFRFVRRDGNVRWVAGCGRTTRDSSGKAIRLFGVNVDITERKRHEEERARLDAQVQHVQRLESLGVVAGGIAHDFNNLLAGILGNAELALNELVSGSAAAKRIEDIRATSERAAELTRQMLAYSGRGQFVLEQLNLNELLRDMSQSLSATVPARANLRLECGASLPLIEADSSQIRQVLISLVTNACESLVDTGGTIVLSTGVTHASKEELYCPFLATELPSGQYVSLRVEDNGCGMDEAVLNRIFEPFYSTKFTGRGLGLAAVLGIVRGHKGSIRMRSEKGKGTSATVYFPVAALQKRVESRDVAPHESQCARITILAVDDEEVMRRVVKMGLEQFGYHVLLASNGREGVDIYARQANEIGLVILDLTMPHMGGHEAYCHMQRINPNVRAILTSGYTQQDAISQFAGQSPAGFIQKPFRIESLAAKVREALAL